MIVITILIAENKDGIVRSDGSAKSIEPTELERELSSNIYEAFSKVPAPESLVEFFKNTQPPKPPSGEQSHDE